MISEFPHSITETASRAENLQRQDTTKKNLMGPILFLYYEESLVSSNLNSKLLRFHSVRPSRHAPSHFDDKLTFLKDLLAKHDRRCPFLLR